MKKYLLGLDNGGTYIKAAVFDSNGNQISHAKKHNHEIILRSRWSEYDLEELWQTNCECMREAIRLADIPEDEIAAIGIASQGCGFYAVDESGKVFRNAITSRDGRAIEQSLLWESNGTEEKAYSLNYRHSFSGHLNTILAWLKENEPENYDRIGLLFSLKDYLVYRLTGEAIAGIGCQSPNGIWNFKTQEFDPQLAQMFGIPEMADKFGKLCWDTDIGGKVSLEAAEQCGCAPGTVVAAGSHDVVATALAMGITSPEYCFIITGTHGINGCLSPTPILNGTVSYNELFAFPGEYLIEEGYPSSSGTLDWVISILFSGQNLSLKEIYDTINCEVMQIKPEEDCPLFLPFLNGYRDNGYASGTWFGLRPEHTRAHLLRAVYEGVAFSHLLQMEHIFANRSRPDCIRMAGGATNSKVWVQIFADVFGIPMEIVSGAEMGAKGAAIDASVACGIYSDVQSAVSKMTCSGEVIEPVKNQ